MKNINKKIQIIWLVLFGLLLLGSLFERGIIFYGLFLAFFLGINQVVASTIKVFFRSEPQFKNHLIWSLLYLVVLFGLNFSGIGIEANVFISYPLYAVPAVLAIYFWYLTFSSKETLATQNHNVFDL